MKAKDYYDQYGTAVLAESYHDDQTDELSKLVRAFLAEMKEIIAARHVHSDRGTVAVIREQNDKWNALCAIFEKVHGVSPIKRNGFMAFMKHEIPQLEDKMWVK